MAAFGKAGFDILKRCFVKHQLFAECIGNGLFRQIVRRGAETACQYNYVRAAQRAVYGFDQPVVIVANGGLQIAVYAKIGQALGNILSIRIYNVAHKQFRTYGNKLC